MWVFEFFGFKFNFTFLFHFDDTMIVVFISNCSVVKTQFEIERDAATKYRTLLNYFLVNLKHKECLFVC